MEDFFCLALYYSCLLYNNFSRNIAKINYHRILYILHQYQSVLARSYIATLGKGSIQLQVISEQILSPSRNMELKSTESYILFIYSLVTSHFISSPTF